MTYKYSILKVQVLGFDENSKEFTFFYRACHLDLRSK
jgi:hypothetical protein